MRERTLEGLEEENRQLRAQIAQLKASAASDASDSGGWIEAFFEHIPLGLVHVRLDGGIVFANAESQRILGLDWDALEARFTTDFAGETFHEDGAPCPVEDYPVSRCLTTGEAQPPKLIGVQQRDGSLAWAIFTAIPTFTRPPRALERTGALVAFVEVTAMQESRLRERELEQRLRQTHNLEALGKLAGGVAHDMNNILAAISGMAWVLREQLSGDHPDAELLQAILRSCARGRELVQNLLGFARRDGPTRQPVSLNAVAREVALLLQRAVPRNLTLELDLGEGLPAVLGDPHQLSTMLLNLGFNAIDACEGSAQCRVIFRTRAGAGSSPDEAPASVCLTVEDEGCGIAEEILPRVLEPFFTTKDVGHGTGLGLSMVWGTVQRHNGELDIQSVVGRGTRITVCLPATSLAEPQPQPPLEERSKRVAPGPAAEERAVLVIDDDEDVLRAHARLLARLGWAVLEAPSGYHAQKLLRRSPEQIVAVLLDLRLPDMDGPDIFASLRSIAPQVPILLTSGHSDPEVVQRLLAQGAAEFLSKPIDPVELQAALERTTPGGALSQAAGG